MTPRAPSAKAAAAKVKYFILDTNVLLHNPNAIYLFEDNHIIVPITVIEEIDKFKREQSEIGRNARMVSRLLDRLRERGKLSLGVKLDGGGTLTIETSAHQHDGVHEIFTTDKMDHRILETALKVRDDHPGSRTILITKDTNLRIKADALNLEAQDFENSKVNFEELYGGALEVTVDHATVEKVYEQGHVARPAIDAPLYPNTFITLVDRGNPQHTALCRNGDNGKIHLIPKQRGAYFGISPRNREQRFALDLLLDEKVRLVTLVGKAGTGKTMLAIAAGLQKVLVEETYQRLLVSRPIYPMGRELGYLPGDLEAKLHPWMQPIFDNLALLLSSQKDKAAHITRLRELIDNGTLELEALTYIRGRSIPNQFMLIDEAQNLTPHEMKTVITRIGEGSKIVITGDPYQIDNPYLDASSNGLTYVVERLKNESIAGHVTLVKGERSGLAELAANLL
ncbi:MAG: PhoH family protein [Deltaproteobacteria bacterium]|nr:PhoH family protein [Deltaproteobacteria bacterium]